MSGLGALFFLAPTLLSTLTLVPCELDYKVDIPSCATFGSRLTRIQLHTLSGRAAFDQLSLTYADRQSQTIKIGSVLERGQTSPWMDLGVHGFNDSRCVAELHLSAKAEQSARVEVFGMVETSGPRTGGQTDNQETANPRRASWQPAGTRLPVTGCQ